MQSDSGWTERREVKAQRRSRYHIQNQPSMPSHAQHKRASIRRQRWKLEFANSFEEAERQTRTYWHNASPAERLNALEQLREPFYAQDQTSPRLQRFLELVPFP